MESTAMVSEIPVCYRFAPTNQEIIIRYLYNKVHGQPLPSNFVIECDLYGEEELWRNIFEETGEKTHYFFTKLKKKKTEKGSRVERGTRSGTWKTQSDQKINFYAEKNQKEHIGSIRKFTFVPKEGFKAKSRWIMHEYRLDGTLLNQTDHNDYVLCRVRVKKDKEEENTTSDINKAILETRFTATRGGQQMEQISNTTSDINKAILETRSPATGGVRQMEHISINNTLIPAMQEVQRMEQMQGVQAQSDLVDNMDSFVEEIEELLSSPQPMNLAETEVQTQVSVTSPEVLVSNSVPESTYPLQWGSNEFTMARADADNVDSFLPRADADNMDCFLEEIEELLSSPSMEPSPMNWAETEVQTQASVMPPEVLVSKSVPESTYPLPWGSTMPRADAMNDSFWGIPDSQKDDWLEALNNALDNYNPQHVPNNLQ